MKTSSSGKMVPPAWPPLLPASLPCPQITWGTGGILGLAGNLRDASWRESLMKSHFSSLSTPELLQVFGLTIFCFFGLLAGRSSWMLTWITSSKSQFTNGTQPSPVASWRCVVARCLNSSSLPSCGLWWWGTATTTGRSSKRWVGTVLSLPPRKQLWPARWAQSLVSFQVVCGWGGIGGLLISLVISSSPLQTVHTNVCPL